MSSSPPLRPVWQVYGEWRTSVRSDRFDEAVEVALDQLLTVRLAQHCGEAPSKAVGKGEPGPIPNQRPIAGAAANRFREDLLAFFDCYGRNGAVPRLSLLPMLEAAIAVGLTTVVLSTVDMVEWWPSTTGSIPGIDEQRPWPLFMDCSGTADPELRGFSEQSKLLVRQQLSQISVALMHMRLLDFYVTNEADIPRRDLPERAPDGTAWLNLLGQIAIGGHDELRNAERFFRSKCRALADAAESEEFADLRADILSNEDNGRKHGARLAEALTLALEFRDKISAFLSSALMTDEPHGLARRRRIVLRKPLAGGRKTADATSFVLSNTVLEYLVHRHREKMAKAVSRAISRCPTF